MLSVSQKALHGKTFHLPDGRLTEASVFPLFLRSGRVELLMVTDAASGLITLVDWRAGLFARALLGPRRLDLPLSQRRTTVADGDDLDAERLDRLWHFDPWWELDENRYAAHPLVPALKATNVCGWDDSWSGVWFSPSLGRVTWRARGEDGSDLARYRAEHLARAERRRRRAGVPPRDAGARWIRRSEWRLRPFWT